MKTYHLIDTIYREYFIEAESEDEAIEKICSGEENPAEEWHDDRLKVVDIHDGKEWQVEPANP